MDDFPYTISDVLRMEGITYKPGKENIRVHCPICNCKKFSQDLTVNLKTEIFNCYAGCGLRGRGATNFYAYLHGISSKEAYENIMSELGLTNTRTHHETRTRIIDEVKEEPSAPEVSDEVKDNTYTHLLSHLKLSERHKNDLLDRGYTAEEISLCNYVSYPCVKPEGITEELFQVPAQLLAQHCELYGVPGFYRTKSKNSWSMMRSKGGIMVPYRNFYNQITAIQIRKNSEDIYRDPESGKMASKYFAFSSSGYKDGCKSSAQAHFACDFVCDKESHLQHPLISKGVIAITEGALKADLAFRISGIPFIGFPGVNCVLSVLDNIIPLLKDIGVHTIAVAYDMDRVTNINVSEALYQVKNFIIEKQMNCQEVTWSKTLVKLDGSQSTINIDSDFVFTAQTLKKAMERKTLPNKNSIDDILSRCIKIGKKNILFAFKNTKEITEQTKELYHVLEKRCISMGLSCAAVLWSLKLKGIDDYFACNKRNIDYTTK